MLPLPEPPSQACARPFLQWFDSGGTKRDPDQLLSSTEGMSDEARIAAV